MSAVKYHYNPKTFRYERARLSIKDLLWYIAGLLFTGLLLGGGMLVARDSLMESETERSLRIENRLLEKHKSIIEEQLTKVNASLAGLKQEDKVLYASLFNRKPLETNPVNTTISREQALLADPSEFRELLGTLALKSNKLWKQSIQSNVTFGNRIRLTRAHLDFVASIPSIQPITNAQLDFLVSGFGERINPFHKGKYNHPGVDFAAPRGTEVFVTAPGRVISVKRTNLQAGYGNYVDVNHGNGFITRYAHLDEIRVSNGQKLEKGKMIGYVGSSGGSIAPHLHYEVIRDGEPVDPAYYLLEGLTSEQHNTLLNLSKIQNQSLD